MLDRLKVLHVTEASSAGVLHSAGRLASLQATAGADVVFAYIRRSDSPPDDAIADLVSPAVAVRFGDASLGGQARIRAIRAFVNSEVGSGSAYDVVHAHSSLAGAAVRLLPTRYDGLIAYSPHGFAFLRKDIGSASRTIFRLAERIASRRGVLIAVSPSEEKIAQQTLGARNTAVVLNGTDATRRRPAPSGPRLRVGTVGRISYSKAPWRFAAASRALSDKAEFVWIGDGPSDDKADWIADAPITVTGWLESEDVQAEVGKLDVFWFASLWEGMPLSLLDAQGMGVPAVATRIVGNQDIVVDGETGYLVDDEEGLLDALNRLLLDSDARERMSRIAHESTTSRFDWKRSADHSLAVYRAHL